MTEFDDRLCKISGLLRCPPYSITFVSDYGDSHWFLQISADRFCNVTGAAGQLQHGRKWRLSPHMTDGEIVQTALKAILAFEEHEIRERFTYRGVSVFDPHFDIEALVALRQSPGGGLKEREAA